MDAKQLEETLAAIANKAKSLRDAGVVGRVSIGDVSFDLTDAQPAAAMTPVVTTQDDGSGNALDDPETYGGYIPQPRGAQRPPEDDEQE